MAGRCGRCGRSIRPNETITVSDAGDRCYPFRRLYEKMRAEMGVRHIEHTEHGWQLTKGDRLVGRIEWDEDTDGQTPLLVIDGKALSWDEVGRMLMTYEGFTLHARVEDSVEVVGGPLAARRPRTLRGRK